MEVLNLHCAGLDVHNDTVVDAVILRVRSDEFHEGDLPGSAGGNRRRRPDDNSLLQSRT
jgi:hypothetical protein